MHNHDATSHSGHYAILHEIYASDTWASERKILHVVFVITTMILRVSNYYRDLVKFNF